MGIMAWIFGKSKREDSNVVSCSLSDAELETAYIRALPAATMKMISWRAASGTEVSEDDQRKAIEANVHSELNRTLARPLSDAEFTVLVNKITDKHAGKIKIINMG